MNREIKNATIESTKIGIECGCMTCWLHLDYGGNGQGFGGYGLDSPLKDEKGKFIKRIGVAFGMEFIKQILEIVGCESWEKLPGKSLRVESDHSKVYRIGHYLKDNWFDPEKLSKEMGLSDG